MAGVHTSELSIDVQALQPDLALGSLILENEAIQVWQASQSAMQRNLPYFTSVLADDEKARGKRFRFDRDRDQFTISRGLLRAILAAYTVTDPATIRFRFSDKGKPTIEWPEAPDLQFNVAHSGDVVLLAFSRGRRLGVDVEQVRTDFATADIAERFFSESERKCLRSITAADRHEAFFRCWTRKEAYIKATGDGLSLPLHQFDVSLRAGEPALLLATRPDASEAERWTMYSLHVAPGYAAALVVERIP